MVTHGHLSTCLRWSSAKLHSWFPQSHQSQVHPSPSCTFFSGIWSPRNLLRTDCCGSWYLTIWLHACGRRLAWNHGCVWWVGWHQALTASLEYGRCRMSWQHIWLYALINGYGLIALCVCTVDVSIEHENHSNGSFCCEILWPLNHFDLHQNYPQNHTTQKSNGTQCMVCKWGTSPWHCACGMCSLWWQSCFWKARTHDPIAVATSQCYHSDICTSPSHGKD